MCMVKVVKAKSANSQGMRAHARKRAVYFLRRFIHERNKHACALFISLQCTSQMGINRYCKVELPKRIPHKEKSALFFDFFSLSGFCFPYPIEGWLQYSATLLCLRKFFFERQGEGGKSLRTSLQFALITYPPICH